MKSKYRWHQTLKEGKSKYRWYQNLKEEKREDDRGCLWSNGSEQLKVV